MGLNFSNKSIVAKLIDAQGVLIQDTSEHLAPENKRAEEVDELINLLSHENKKIARVLCYHYTSEGSKEERIRNSGISERTYYRHLSVGEEWVHRYLQ